MTFVEIVNILLTIVVLLVGAYSAYAVAGNDVYSKITFLIAEASKLDLIGPEKMQTVVNKLYEAVPIAYRKILTREKLQKIAQKAYDNMKLFAKRDNKEKKK